MKVTQVRGMEMVQIQVYMAPKTLHCCPTSTHPRAQGGLQPASGDVSWVCFLLAKHGRDLAWRKGDELGGNYSNLGEEWS